MKTTLTLLTLAFLFAGLTVTPLLAKDEAPDPVETFEEQMKDADEATKVKLIEQLVAAQPENKDASKALSKLVRDRSTAVSVAAIRGLGAYKDKAYFGMLLGLLKSYEDDSKRMEAALLAIGELGDKRAKKELIDIAKKWLPKDAVVASAAATALGSVKDRECVDELIKLLDLTYPKQAASGPAVSQETRKILSDSRPSIMGGLSALTGWDFGDPRAWAKFWDRESKRWKPGQEEKRDMTAIKTWEDPGYGFEITKPADRWIFAKAEGCRITVTRSEETLMQANVYVQAYDMKNYTALTAEQKAQAKEDEAKNSYKDIKEESWVREPIRVGKEKGFLQAFTGRSGTGAILKVRTIFVVKDEFMYVVGSWIRSGSPADVDAEVQKALDSFVLKD